MISKRESDIINFLKGGLAVLVVAFHTSYASDLNYSDGLEPFLRVLISKFGGVAVPTFFFISGYLFFYNIQEWNWIVWKEKVCKRIKTLLVPFILWIVIAVVLKYIWSVLKQELPGFSFDSFREYVISKGGIRMFYDRPQQTSENSMLGYIVDTSKPIDRPLWYIRELFVLVVSSPLIWKIIKLGKQYAILILGVVYLLCIGLPFVLLSPTALFFFSTGAFWSIKGGESFLDDFRRCGVMPYALSAVFLILSFVIQNSEWNGFVFRLFVISSMVMSFNLMTYIYDAGKLKPIKLFTESSFFIYACHAILILDISNMLLWRTLPFTSEWILVLKVFLRPAVAVGICLLLFIVLKKICPKILGVLTGGRF